MRKIFLFVIAALLSSCAASTTPTTEVSSHTITDLGQSLPITPQPENTPCPISNRWSGASWEDEKANAPDIGGWFGYGIEGDGILGGTLIGWKTRQVEA